MRKGAGLSLLAILALMSASSVVAEPSTSEAVTSDASCAAPPCGYITPQMNLDFPDKPKCGSGLRSNFDRTTCIPLPARGESKEFMGTVIWFWDITQDGVYPPDAQTPITIQFSGTATNPKWLALVVEPESITLDLPTMLDPANTKLNTDDPTKPQLYFWYEEPLKITVKRIGDPADADLARLHNQNDIVKMFLKGKSNASGSYFKEAFGVEEFRFDACADPTICGATAGNEAPAPVAPLVFVGLVAAAAFVQRRHQLM